MKKPLHEIVLERRLEYQQRQSARQQIISKVGDEAIKELPQDLLRRQAQRALQRKVMEMRTGGMRAANPMDVCVGNNGAATFLNLHFDQLDTTDGFTAAARK